MNYTDIPRIALIYARKFKINGMTEEDKVQECMLAYLRAQKAFDPAQNTQFNTYASRVIRNRLIDIARKTKHDDDPIDENTLIDPINPDDKDNINAIKKILAENVGERDRMIFNAYVQGLTYDEMAKIFEITRKNIDNSLQKTKKVIKCNL